VGAPPGYVGYDEGGQLTEAVRRRPYSIILLDEIEKAHPDTFNILLQVLDDGRLTDNKGRVANFKNTIIIMTSNIGQEEFAEKANKIGFDISDSEENTVLADYEKASKNVKDNLTHYFSPEFVNRIDKVIVFNPLDKNEIKKIVKLHLDNLETRLAGLEITLKYDIKIINYIAKKVYNPEFGAREIRRYITDNIEDIIAEQVILGSKKKAFELKIEKDTLEIK